MKKILFLSDVDISIPGGAQESMKIIMNELIDYHEFFLITPKGNKMSENHIVFEQYDNFILRKMSIKKLFILVSKIRRKIKIIQPDIIHIQMPSTMVIISFLKSMKMINKDIRVIYTDRGVYGKYGKLTTKSINRLIPKADNIITTTVRNQMNYKKLYSKFQENNHKFLVIPNTAGVIFEDFDLKKRITKRAELDIKNEDFVIGFCGRYTEQKNWPLAKSIINKMKKNPCVKFVLVIGSDGTIENKKALINYIKDIKSIVGNDRVHSFINISNSEVADIYYTMDTFILTSKWESFGRTAVEAMARENVVFGTNVDGIPEVIGAQEYVFQEADEILEKLETLSNDKELLEKERAKFYKRYFDEFSYKENIKKHLELYNSSK